MELFTEQLKSIQGQLWCWFYVSARLSASQMMNEDAIKDMLYAIIDLAFASEKCYGLSC